MRNHHLLISGLLFALWVGGIGEPDGGRALAEEHSHFVVVDRQGREVGTVVEIEEDQAQIDLLREINGRVVLISIVGERITGSYHLHLAYSTEDCTGTPYLPLPTKVSSLVEHSIVEGDQLLFTAMNEARTIREKGRKPRAAGTCLNLVHPKTSGSPYGGLPGQSAERTIHAVPFSGTLSLKSFQAPFKIVAR